MNSDVSPSRALRWARIAALLACVSPMAGACSADEMNGSPHFDAGAPFPHCSTDDDCPPGYPCQVVSTLLSNGALPVDAAVDAAPPPRITDASTDGPSTRPFRDAATGGGPGDASPGSGGVTGKGGSPPAPLKICASRCQDAACKTALGDHAECNLRTGRCERVDCGRTVACTSQNSALYCNVDKHSCHRTNGVCGLVGNESFPCPELDGELPPDVSISCSISGTGTAGVCTLAAPTPSTPGVDGLPKLAFDSPKDGKVFSSVDEIFFTYRVSGAHFLLVTDTVPETLTDLTAQALWGLALPQSNTALRQVHWTDGFAIQDGRWQETAGTPPERKDLFAAIVQVNGGESPVAATPNLLRFRYRVGWSSPGTPCADAGAGGCYNPTVILGCISGTCRQLCVADDCPGNRYCDFGAPLPYCAGG